MAKGYTESDIRLAVASSESIAEALRKLHLIPAGGNYRTLREKITFLIIDTSHFTGQGWRRGKKYGPVRPLKEYLFNGSKITSH